ncbi:MAG: hypothetical protein E7056_08145 [Lentisphaerae bacterium]|nr:hypothetical protein [Lentisphaerota bacterium]
MGGATLLAGTRGFGWVVQRCLQVRAGLGWVVQRCLQVRAGLVSVVSPAIARVALFGPTCQTGRTGRKELPA